MAVADSVGGTVVLDPAQPAGGYLEGTEVTLTAVPNDGYRFEHWGEDISSADNPTTIVLDSQIRVGVVFSRVVFPWWLVVVGLIVVLPLGLLGLRSLMARRKGQ